MIATLTTTVPGSMKRRSSNTASAPLPLIPRRTSSQRCSSTPTNGPSYSLPLSIIPVTTITSPSTSPPQVARSKTHGSSGSESSSSSGDNFLSIRPKRIRGVRYDSANGLRKPEFSTPAPARSTEALSASSPETTPRPKFMGRFPSLPTTAEPTSPRPALSLDGLKSRTFSESDVSVFGIAPSYSAPLDQTPSVRKKSGEPVISSLKGSRAKIRGSISVVTDVFSPSKSAPATPNRGVQFNAELEQVKLFFAEQKPLAVSRDGSPTEDTSGTDNDFPSWIYGDSALPASKMRLSMKLLNKPNKVNMDASVALEDMSLAPDGTNILGRIRVRNMAFQKWVVVRFTFDQWQTTSEVSAKYSDSIDAQFDRFVFTVKLNDMMARIEGKTMELAVRYSIHEREMWDNNLSKNYLSTFTKVKGRVSRFTTPRLDKDNSDVDSPVILDLQNKLENVAKHQLGSSIPASTSLKARYDFGVSLKESSWKSPDSAAPSRPHPSCIPFPSSSVISPPPRDVLVHGSPRDAPEVLDSLTIAPESPNLAAPRNHHRGYFDMVPSLDSSVRKTPPGTPKSPAEAAASGTPRYHSFPPLGSEPTSLPLSSIHNLGNNDFRLELEARLERTASDSTLSTPSIVSPSTSDSMDSSPALSSPVDSQPTSPSESADYRDFLDKFCFFTGTAGHVAPLPTTPTTPSAVPRSASISSVDDLFATPKNAPVSRLMAPQRSISLDGLSTTPPRSLTSGSATPTKSNLGLPTSSTAEATV